MINRVVLVGNATRDAEVRQAGESQVASFGIALNRKFKKKDGSLGEETTFVDVEFWGKVAEIAGKFVTKGKLIGVDGSLELDTWEKDGEKRSKLRVRGQDLKLLGGNPNEEAKPAQSSAPANAAGSGDSQDLF